MSGKYESGHVKNLVFFEELTIHCQSLGKKYIPAYEDLSADKLDQKFRNACAIIDEVNEWQEKFTKSVENRRSLFRKISFLANQVSIFFEPIAMPRQEKFDILSAAKKLKGKKAKEIINTSIFSEPANYLTVDHLSAMEEKFTLLANQFEVLISLLKNQPKFRPAVADLRIAYLEARYREVEYFNAEVINAFASYCTAKGKRDFFLYKPITGLITIASQVKDHIKSSFGMGSHEYKQIEGLSFRIVKQKYSRP